MASHSILSQLCRQEVQNPGVISAAFSWKGEPLPCRSQRLLAILGHHWLGDASPRPCLQLPMGSYTLSSGLEISLFLVELWLICIVVWQKPPQHCKAIILQLNNERGIDGEETETSHTRKLAPGQGSEQASLRWAEASQVNRG